MRIPRDSQTKTLLKNIAAKKWREVSNGILKHVEIMPELSIGICKLVSKEFDEYMKSECMLDELAGFSNKLFMDMMEEVRVFCPRLIEALPFHLD